MGYIGGEQYGSQRRPNSRPAILEAAEDNPGHTRLMHHVVVGLTWLKKRLAALGLKRRNVVETRLTLVHLAIKNELQTSNCCLGYRAMWRLLQLKYRYTIKRSTVMMLLAVMDPIASRLRDYRSMHRSS
ncbi:hypothetical protein EMCRGX_G002531 [Ephydatia muelleri]